jgi:signal transduction histidine kinase
MQFTKKGYVVVGARLEPVSQAHKVRVTLYVRDTGIGVAAEDVPKLFQSYSQAKVEHGRRGPRAA